MTTSEFIDVFNEHRMFVFFLCKKRGYSTEDSEDISSQVFISLWKHKDNLPATELKPYISIITINQCRDLDKYNNARIQIINVAVNEDITEDIEEVDTKATVLSHIHNIIEALPPKQKAFTKLKYIDGKKPAQIAEIFKIKPITVSNQLVTALSKIRKELKNRGIHLDSI